MAEESSAPQNETTPYPSLEADPSVMESSSVTDGFLDKPVDETFTSSEVKPIPDPPPYRLLR